MWANIDHHQTNERFGDVQCVLPDECATGAVLYYFFKYLGIPFTPVMRDALYVAVSTDTGSFQYQMTTAAVMELAAGPDPGWESMCRISTASSIRRNRG